MAEIFVEDDTIKTIKCYYCEPKSAFVTMCINSKNEVIRECLFDYSYYDAANTITFLIKKNKLDRNEITLNVDSRVKEFIQI